MKRPDFIKLGIPRVTVTRKIADFTQNVESYNLGIFRNYEQDDSESSGRRIDRGIGLVSNGSS